MHKINTVILTRFLFILDSTKAIQTGKTVTYEIRKPDDTVFASGNMAEIGTTGFYKQSWTPNVVGWWIFKISCASPVANDVRAYFVESGLEKDIKDLLEHATYGLSALETLVDGVEAELTVIKGAGFVQATDALSKIRDAIDALNNLSQADILSDATPFAGADIAIIKGYVDEIESLLKDGTYGLSALNTKLVAIQADLDSPNQYKADVTGLALEATLTAMKGAGWTTETLKAIYDAMALESTLTAIKGGGWTNETLKAIKDAIDALNNLSAAGVWGYGTRTLTDPASYKADVSALALEATLGTHDTDIKAELGHATYGLSAIETLVDELESRLTATRAGYLDNLSVGAVALQSTLSTVNTSLDFIRKATVGVGSADVVSDGGNTSSTFKTGLPSSVDDYYKGLQIVFIIDAPISPIQYQVRRISAYDGTTKFITVSEPFTATPNAGDSFLIVSRFSPDISPLALEATLGTHDTDIKAELGHATYGLPALNNDLDTIISGTCPKSGAVVFNWAKRIEITIDHNDIDTSLENFPVLIYLSSLSGINGKDVTCVFDEIGANSKKIAVLLSDGVTQCYVEIEKWDAGSEEAWLWVKVPNISHTEDTILYLYYDNTQPDNTTYVGDPNSAPAENVWDANFKFVSHMRDDPDTSHIRDSTGNNNDGTKKGANEPVVTPSGRINDAQDFDGGDDFITVTDADSLDVPTDFTLECWINRETQTTYDMILTKGPDTQENYQWRMDANETAMVLIHQKTEGGVQQYTSNSVVTTGAWNHIATVLESGGNVVFYRNGVACGTSAQVGTLVANVSDLFIGKRNDGHNFDGMICEIRISDIVRNASWMKATYETGRDHLINWGDERGPSTFNTDLTNVNDDFYENLMIVFTSGDNQFQARRISGYDGTDKTITVSEPFTATPVDGDAFLIISRWTFDETKIDTIDTIVDAILADTNELQGDWTNGGRLDLIIDAIKAKTDNLPASPAPASEYDTEMARITADVATEAKQDIIDTNVDDIESDTSDIQPRIPRITCHMDFWSNSQAIANITAGGEAGVVSLPDVVVAGLPTGVTIIRVVALLKIAIIKDTSGSDNAVDVATGHVEVQKGGAGGYVTAIDIPEDAWSVDVSEATERGGDVMIGDNDLGPSGANKVDGNATYNFEFDDIGSDGTNLQLVDVMVGLRVYYTV